jgi:hypothetical protein
MKAVPSNNRLQRTARDKVPASSIQQRVLGDGGNRDRYT